MSRSISCATGAVTALAPQLRKHNPCSTLDEIAVMVSKTTDHKVSRQRVYQVLKKAGVQTCGRFPKKYMCNNCGKEFLSLGKRLYFCSVQCYRDYYIVTLECMNCKRKFKRPSSQVRHMLLHPNHKGYGPFCSHQCFGQYMGTHYGFRAHPENQAFGPKSNHAKKVLVNA